MKIKSVILAGGSGTRLWPLSRELYPKQFLKFSGKSLFQDTLLRCLTLSDISEIFVVTSERQKFFVYGQIEELELELFKENVLLEPNGKNTLPAICLAMCEIEKKYGRSVVGVFSSDHILDIEAMQTIAVAERLTDKYLVTFGIVPESPHTGYGYIKTGSALDVGFEVSEFKEKPGPEDAEMYVKSGYLWNSGMFLFGTELFRTELQLHAPGLWNEFYNSNRNVEDIYLDIPTVSVDYGLMEISSRVAVVKLDNKWSDLGNFEAMFVEFDKNEHDNVVYNCVDASIDSKRNLIFSLKNKAVSLIDVDDMVVVDTRDALLVCPRSSSQKVKDVVSRLKEQGDERADIHQTAYRPWGSYTVLESSEKYKIKNIRVMPKKRLSLQLHAHRSEHWVVVKGRACVQVDGEQRCLGEGESTFISAGVKHRLFNPGVDALEIIEVQLGEYVGEDDIVRFDDMYGRV
ncbi:MAG: mannose-1-phosphate guanylyltransferase/mannose-6-phosphate isomerase [Methanosarcinales archaeon]|nr:mannose-1-phosphate guanylyltransferase/mannose-6-phosphate isomerase [Methanosarcinales archaeon]